MKYAAPALLVGADAVGRTSVGSIDAITGPKSQSDKNRVWLNQSTLTDHITSVNIH